MADSEKSLLFVIRANIVDFNKSLGDAERSFNKSFGNIQKTLDKTGNTFMGIGGAITGAFVGATLNFAKTADDLTELSARTGIGVEELQKLGYAAKVSGSDLGGLETAVKKMQVSIYADSDAFAALGLSLDSLKTMDTTQQFNAVMKALASIPDASTRAALAVKVFGKAGTDMLPMLENGAAGFDRLKKAAEDMGLVISEKTVKAAGALNDKIDAMKMVFLATTAKIAQTKVFTDLTQVLINIIGKIGEWIDKNPGWVRAIGEAGIAILVVGAAIKGAAIAMAIFKAFQGPAGWVQLAIGATAAAASIGLIESELNKVHNHNPEIDALKDSLDGLGGDIDTAQAKLNKLNATPVITFGGGGTVGHGVTGGWAEGGVFTRPTFGLIGEAGPEAVIPLDRLRDVTPQGASVTVNVGNYMGDEISKRALVRDIQRILNEENRRSVTPNTQTSFYSVGGHL